MLANLRNRIAIDTYLVSAPSPVPCGGNVLFDVIEEDGRPVIDDIHRVVENERDSVIEEMESIAKGE